MLGGAEVVESSTTFNPATPTDISATGISVNVPAGTVGGDSASVFISNKASATNVVPDAALGMPLNAFSVSL
jgi:hypothetical protein